MSVIVLLFCYSLLYVHSSIAIILMGKRELVAMLNLSSWCLVMVEWLFLVVPWGCLPFVIVVFLGHTHLLFWAILLQGSNSACVLFGVYEQGVVLFGFDLRGFPYILVRDFVVDA